MEKKEREEEDGHEVKGIVKTIKELMSSGVAGRVLVATEEKLAAEKAEATEARILKATVATEEKLAAEKAEATEAATARPRREWQAEGETTEAAAVYPKERSKRKRREQQRRRTPGREMRVRGGKERGRE